ncbi:hypothetical protein DFH08DRAFT_958691 [Mycena albidolilacea]|uniref:Uncharacterized protein n=1 Tax=Mycena albidolilacea TaxID=1033008 RepID=A0AAD7ESV4_9AGAR|nr:hypothetical protein DFH08DRAFT_958691 [Mycena albidolilacea]
MSSKPEFDVIKADFLKAVKTAHSLATYQAPLSAREKQLESVGSAVVHLTPVISLMLDEGSPILHEALFQVHSLYHHICNLNNTKNYSYPHNYSEVIRFTLNYLYINDRHVSTTRLEQQKFYVFLVLWLTSLSQD